MKVKKLISATRGGFMGLSKPLMVGLIVLCLVLAVVAYIYLLPEEGSGIEDLAGIPIWVKCNNPDCNAEFETDEAEFRAMIGEEKKKNPLFPGSPPVACKQCSQMSLLEAVKCPKAECGAVFFYGELGPREFRDKCPKCGYSATQEKRKKSAEAAGQSS
ncbi:MAG: hypothetical protein ACYTE8_03425 [Planctomycetota bacterium]|jgi:hypothetical protein